MDKKEVDRESLANKIAGEIVMSPSPGKTIQKWRGIFKISQRKLADEMKMMPSVISDYEKGRRSSPGSKVIKKIVNALISCDEREGGNVVREFGNISGKNAYSDAVIDIMEFNKAVSVKDFCRTLGANLVTGDSEKEVNGYTIVDGAKAIVEMPAFELVKLYGATSKRALIFVGTNTGRTSLVAIKVTNLRPALVIVESGSGSADPLAKRIADIEGIPLAILKTVNAENVKQILRRNYS